MNVKLRNGKGTIMIISAMLALYVLPLIGLFAFDAGRTILAQQQLQNAADAAVLSAAATIGGTDATSVDLMETHRRAVESARDIMTRNAVFDILLSKTSVVSNLDSTPGLNKCQIQVEFLDPQTQQVVAQGDTRAKIVRVNSRFCTETAFGKHCGFPTLTVAASSVSALPKLDLVICVDVSNSMDDQTPITLVKRSWDPASGKIVYAVAQAANGQLGEGSENAVSNSTTMGSQLVAVEPQHLTGAYFDNKFLFSEYVSKQMSQPALRARSAAEDSGGAPGNYPNALPAAYGEKQVFTDLVVNIDGRTHFQGVSIDGYNFPDLATLVEAARGNLENAGVFQSSKANLSVSVVPKAGYKQKYQELAQRSLQPLRSVQSSMLNLVNLMNSNADTHFSFVSFASTASRDANSSERHGVIDEDLPTGSGYADKKSFVLPYVPMSKVASSADECRAALGNTVPLSGTNIGDAVDAAVEILSGSNSRKNAAKAIVLFTDGIPTVAPGVVETSGPPPFARPNAYARESAKAAGEKGIAIFSIGLSQNPKIVPLQRDILTDANSDPVAGGISGIAGNGGVFVQVADAAQLDDAFRKVIRSLVRLVNLSPNVVHSRG